MSRPPAISASKFRTGLRNLVDINEPTSMARVSRIATKRGRTWVAVGLHLVYGRPINGTGAETSSSAESGVRSRGVETKTRAARSCRAYASAAGDLCASRSPVRLLAVRVRTERGAGAHHWR